MNLEVILELSSHDSVSKTLYVNTMIVARCKTEFHICQVVDIFENASEDICSTYRSCSRPVVIEEKVQLNASLELTN